MFIILILAPCGCCYEYHSFRPGRSTFPFWNPAWGSNPCLDPEFNPECN